MKQVAELHVKEKQHTDRKKKLQFVFISDEGETVKKRLREYVYITFSVLLIMLGSHFFKFPNNFTFGGITGLSVIIGKVALVSPSTANMILNGSLLVLGFIFLGKDFGLKTVYSTLLLSFGLSFLDKLHPVTQPLTSEPLLELVFAIILPALGSAILFNIGASSGGTDVIAMILRKYTSVNIGMTLLWTDFVIIVSTFFVFDMQTFLFSFLGMITKSLIIDNVIESINLCKYLNVVCSNPQPICDFITYKLKRSATICQAEGAFTHQKKYVVMTALKRPQAVLLRQYIKTAEPTAFITIVNTSEIFGKGFMG